MTTNDRIKDIATVRKWLREFSLFGDKTRADFVEQSGYRHAYEKTDHLLDRILCTVRDKNNRKHVFFSVDARDICHNPLYIFYKIHAFEENDIKLHFTILNSLSDGHYKTKEQIVQDVFNTNVYSFDDGIDSTLYRKLEEYLELGILISQMDGRIKKYALNQTCIDLKHWVHAILFFSEIDPLGVIGDYLRDRLDRTGDLPVYEPFLFRHHYIHHGLDVEIVQTIAEAIHKQSSILVSTIARHNSGNNPNQEHACIPIRFYYSVQSGRRYITVCRKPTNELKFIRLDRIQSVQLGEAVPDYDRYCHDITERLKYVWGVSDIGSQELTHLEMTIKVQSPDDYTLKRLEVEKRHGRVERIDEVTSRFSIDVWEVHEMLPWIRTFIGYIVSLKCSNPHFVEHFKNDLCRSFNLYTQD